MEESQKDSKTGSRLLSGQEDVRANEENIISSGENEIALNEKNIESSEPQTQNPTPETDTTEPVIEKDMEVHHHSHSHGKKNWRSYFWEFLMLFLAVFCGFLAEYQLEHKIERDREKQFVQSLLKDLTKDTVSINKAVYGNAAILKGLDTLLNLIAIPSKENRDNKELFLYSIKYTYWYFKVQFSELTLSQLKNSGGYRLIKNTKVAEGIADYALGMEACRNQESSVFQYFHVYENTQKDIISMIPAKKVYTWFENDIMNMLSPMHEIEERILKGNYILPGAAEHMSRYYSDILFFSTSLKNFSSFLKTQKQKTSSLSQLIRDNYNLKN